MPNPIAPTNGTDFFATQAAADTAQTPAKASTMGDSDTFLKLLVAQIKYQNPMEPMAGTEFIAQSAQLATVQALQAIQKSQSSADTWSRMAAAQQMLGTTVNAVDADGNAVTGLATGVKATSDGPRLTLTTSSGTVEVGLDAVRGNALVRTGASATTSSTGADTATTPTTATAAAPASA